MIRTSPLSLYESFFFWYFFSINIIYTFLLILGIFNVYKRRKELSVEDFTNILNSNTLPEITFIIPMYNEEKNILGCIKSIQNLSYRYKKIICVNDGSTDKTMAVLKKAFDLVEIPDMLDKQIPQGKLLGVFRSKTNPEILFLDKEHKGKYDANNAGVNACQSPYFIAVDADTFIDNVGFEALIRPILAYPETVACGSTIRIKNGCSFDYNKINTKKLSFSFLPIYQGLEYLRSFFQRQGWNSIGGNFVIAGAFSIFPKQVVIQAGGFSTTVAEDMEIIVRLHHIFKKRNKRYRIAYLPDPVAWTEGPSNYKALQRQRSNWHWGTLETLYYHKSMMFNPRYGFFGFFNYPFYLLAEGFEPVVEAIGIFTILFAYLLGQLNTTFFLLLTLVTLGFSFVYSLICILIEELSFKKYDSFKTVCGMFILSLFENLGYRQMTVYWRLVGFYKFFKNFSKTQKESFRIKKMMKKF